MLEIKINALTEENANLVLFGTAFPEDTLEEIKQIPFFDENTIAIAKVAYAIFHNDFEEQTWEGTSLVIYKIKNTLFASRTNDFGESIEENYVKYDAKQNAYILGKWKIAE